MSDHANAFTLPGEDGGMRGADKRHKHARVGSKVQPVTIANAAALRMLRLVAGSIVVIPLLATIYAMGLVIRRGISVPEFVLLASMYTFTLLGITVGFHRHFAHRSFKTSGTMKMLLAVLGSMAGQGPLYWWVATHRRHHRFSDGPGDPHSPNLVPGNGVRKLLSGFWHGHIAWMFSSEITNWAYFAPDLIRDRRIFLMHRLYWFWMAMGLTIPTCVGWVWIGGAEGAWLGLLWGGLVRLCLVDHASWCVGSISHMFGSRPFEKSTRDRSANNWFVAIVAFGEGLQNNHHAFANSAAHAVHWWEPDLSVWVIRVLRRLGLVWEVNHPTAAMLKAKREGPPTNATQAGSESRLPPVNHHSLEQK